MHAPPKPNLWLLSWTIPVFVVLLWLPIEQELEDARLHFGERASLEARLAVLSKHPDFVVHAASNIRLMGGKDSHHSAEYYSSHCLRIHPTPGSKRQSKSRIRNIRIVGERNSGVQLLRSDLQKAFRSTNITVENGVTRWVYWFQDPVLARFVEGHNPDRSVVIHVATEPYEWMSRMQENPIHAPYHRRPAHGGPSGLNSNESIFTKPWTMPKPDWDTGPHLGHCQYRYPVGAVVPCAPGKVTGPKANKLYPVYEMNQQTFKPFANIAQLRNAKIANFLNLSSWMPHTIHVRSSDVISLRGVNSLVSDLVDKYGLQACEVRRDRRYLPTFASSGTKTLPNSNWELAQPHSWNVSAPPLTAQQQRWVTCNIDWHAEGLLGFQPREDPRKVCPGPPVGQGGVYDFHPSVNSKDKRQGFFYKIFDGIASQSMTRPPSLPLLP